MHSFERAKVYNKLGMSIDLLCLFGKLKIPKSSGYMTPSQNLKNEHFAFQMPIPYWVKG